ncbi:MAG TPA: hypothetical protein VMO26_01595 [Vicinamibacterales bacterium]|nr:hypothetical protein [Vicinamibacterales bacterium]
MTPSPLIPWTGMGAILGGAIWTLSYVMNALTQDGTRAVLGLSEPGWRTVLNPAMVFFMAALLGFHRQRRNRLHRLGLAGLLVSIVALLAMLVGNILEFWVFPPSNHAGWITFLGGFFLLGLGNMALGAGAIRSRALGTYTTALLICWLPVGLLEFLLRRIGVSGVMSGVVLLGLFPFAWIGLGYDLWRSGDEDSRAPHAGRAV